MAQVRITPLGEDLGFGSVVAGLDEAGLADPALRAELKALFEERGLILFRGAEGHAMQRGISLIFGPLKDHPIAAVSGVEGQPGMIDMRYNPDAGSVFEIEGREVAHWLPWHFDHC